MKFKVDENLPDELSQLLVSAGWDSITVVQQQMGGEQDPQLASVCCDEQRIFITFDRGFSNIRAYPPAQYPGMIVFRLKSQDKHHVLSVARRVVTALVQRELRNELWIVTETRIRIRSV